jgi:hypothetical protein
MSLWVPTAPSVSNVSGGWNRVNTGIIISLKMKQGVVNGFFAPGTIMQKTTSTGIYMAFSHELR